MATYQIATADLSWKQQLHKKSFFQIGMKYTYTGMKDDACYEGLEILTKVGSPMLLMDMNSIITRISVLYTELILWI